MFERKYLEPVMSCREIELVPFRLQSTNQRRIIEHIRSAYEAVDAETEGYEILARNELSSAWLLMMRELPASVRNSYRVVVRADGTILGAKRNELFALNRL